MFHCCCWTHSLSSIQGCDSGFGHELAKRLSEMGVMVFAGVLDVDGVGAQRLRERAPENLRVLQLDVTDSSQIEAVHRYVCSQVAATGETKRVAGEKKHVYVCLHMTTLTALCCCRLVGFGQ